MKTIISISEARKNIFKIADDIQKTGSHYILTENGRSKVVIISSQEFDSWVETLEVIKDFPGLEKDIKEADSDYKTGKYKNYPTLDEILAKEGYIFADKVSKKYDIPTKIKNKRKKRT